MERALKLPRLGQEEEEEIEFEDRCARCDFKFNVELKFCPACKYINCVFCNRVPPKRCLEHSFACRLCGTHNITGNYKCAVNSCNSHIVCTGCGYPVCKTHIINCYFCNNSSFNEKEQKYYNLLPRLFHRRYPLCSNEFTIMYQLLFLMRRHGFDYGIINIIFSNTHQNWKTRSNRLNAYVRLVGVCCGDN